MKHHLRKEIRRKLAKMPPDVAAGKSHAACSALLGLGEFHDADVVMLYMPIAQEVDCVPVALAAWQQDKTVLLPRVNWDQRHMIALQCRSMDDDLAVNRGLREPADGEPWPVEEIDLIVVPALAYDRRGHRLGRGGGFYDRFLAEPNVRAMACGLAFDEQVVDELPTHDHDYPVDILVTDKEVLRFDRT